MMSKKQTMYWGDNKFCNVNVNFYPLREGMKMRLTSDGPNLEAYYNNEGFLCVVDPDTNEEVMAVWG